MTDSPTISSTDSDLYRRLIDSVRDYGIVSLDANGAVVTWNPGAQRFTQFAPNEAVQRPFSSFFTEEERANRKADLLLAAAVRDGRADLEVWLLRKDRSSFCAHVALAALRDAIGAFVGFSVVVRD